MTTGQVAPIAPAERIQLLDVLRGFALFGVLIANLVWVATFEGVTRDQMEALPTAAIDQVTRHFLSFFIEWKFYTLFSFLFGLGFSVQMARAAERGGNARRTYLRRLTVLLAIGLAHTFLLWYGDILNIYALLGYLLFFCRGLRTRTLLVLSALLILLPQTLIRVLPHLAGSPELSVAAQAVEEAAEEAEEKALRAHRFQVYTYGTYSQVVAEHVAFFFSNWFFQLYFNSAVFGKFLLGLVAGRLRLFHDPQQHPHFFRRLLVWGLVVGVLGNTIFVLQGWLTDNDILPGSSPAILATLWTADLGLVGLTAFYAAAIALLFQRPAWRARLSLLAPLGRMALTNYLAHSLIYAFLFYGYGIGLGLLGKIGATACVLLGIFVYCLQILFSRWWLSRWAFGPMEWLWRSLTYGRLQPMRLQSSPRQVEA
jgi:uncharacterized protein